MISFFLLLWYITCFQEFVLHRNHKINDKETVKFFRKELYTVRKDITRDLQAVPLILPQIENLVANNYEMYEEHIQKEFEMEINEEIYALLRGDIKKDE